MVVILLVGLISSLLTVVATVGIMLLINVNNNTKRKEVEDDSIITYPIGSYTGGGHSGGQTISLADLLRMQQYVQAAKEKDTHKTEAGGGQYL